MGESVLRAFTDKRGIDKWQLSPLTATSGQKFIPTFDLGRMQKQFELGTYFEMALRRAAEEARTPFYSSRPAERFLLNPGIEETLSVLEMLEEKEEVACDIETGYGQINTVGFAWSESDAIAINVLPDRCSDETYYRLWLGIARVLAAGSRKVLQNFIYDVSYFSAYGCPVNGEIFDTMWAMKVLWPEFKSNLGNVGRIYTKRPYWKDDGKVTDEEGSKKDWGNVRDWTKHYQYNCRDTTGTLEASRSQRLDLKSRGLDRFFVESAQQLAGPVLEMCTNGMPLDLSVRAGIAKETEGTIERLTKEFQIAVGSELNPRSSKQVISHLRSQGVKLPKKYNKEKGTYNESADASSIKKIRLKSDLPGLKELQQIKTLDKALSSYINFEVRPDGRLSYSLNGCGTETLRMSGGKDGWGRGVNIQTIPREGEGPSIKSQFVAPEAHSFLEVDLRQAESRFVAYDSADKTLIDMLESGHDVHSHVGRAILRQMGRDPDSIPLAEFKQTWRQLGKKAGHGLNYWMKARMFVETVFNELDLVISVRDAELITEAYYGLFPGIPRWHAWIRRELYTKRKLSTPSGWERYFYGRPGDDMQKEAYAFRPQHTIPWITNRLMLHLCEVRRKSGLRFNLLAQVHDSLILLVPDETLNDVAKICSMTDPWHPVIDLPGGRLVVPTETKVGTCLATMKEHLV
jgi:DNA polymerase I-like protein with 3'-5' exonuclease and polymerase domains